MPLTVTLAGPAPWGFRVTGGRDFGKPITISKVTEHGKAAAGDLRAGDIIVTINGESTAEMLNVEAQNKIKRSSGELQLQVERSPMPPSSHTNGDTSPERLATRFQVSPGQLLRPPQTPTQGWFQLLASPSPPQDTLQHPAPLSLCQERGSLSQQHSTPGSILPPAPPRPPSPSFGTPPQNPWEPWGERSSSPPASSCNSLGSEPAMRRWEEDSEVYKMLQANRELRAAPRQSSTFRLLQEALEDEDGAVPAAPHPSWISPGGRRPVAGVQKLHLCEKCGSSIA
ncbi:PDLI2 protein, partial [Tricholaema leucomelas]|nr:PDLI2 protein [Tricholaema leucomelas]